MGVRSFFWELEESSLGEEGRHSGGIVGIGGAREAFAAEQSSTRVEGLLPGMDAVDLLFDLDSHHFSTIPVDVWVLVDLLGGG